MAILIAPTEPKRLKALGIVSSVPESFGADVLWDSAKMGGVIGVQRKELSDMINSVRDGRLGKEIAQLSRCSYGALIVEGTPRWTTDGELVDKYNRWSRQAHRSLLRSVQNRGVEVIHTDSITDTIEAILDLRNYLERDDHHTLDRRPNPRGAWGSPTAADFGSHVLQSAPGVGPKLAKAIYDHFDGVPIGWTCTREELLAVDGLGPGRVDKLWEAFGGK